MPIAPHRLEFATSLMPLSFENLPPIPSKSAVGNSELSRRTSAEAYTSPLDSPAEKKNLKVDRRDRSFQKIFVAQTATCTRLRESIRRLAGRFPSRE